MGMITILKKKTGYGLGLSFCIIGVVLLLAVVWKWWDTGVFSSSDVLSALSASFTGESLWPGLALGYYLIIGVVLLGTGSAILLLRREKVAVTEGLTVVLECPLCKHHWQEAMSKSQLHAMGYPEVRSLSRRKCAKCAKFIRPKIIETRKG
jgi:hypothetical protein